MRHQPDVICLQEHNQHAMAGDVSYFGGYDIFYSGGSDYSGIAMLVTHDLQHQVSCNDPLGRLMVMQMNIHGDIHEIAAVYAS